jgi:hypothetical protein
VRASFTIGYINTVSKWIDVIKQEILAWTLQINSIIEGKKMKIKEYPTLTADELNQQTE